ncbi:hypothetical protein KJY77_02920 [Canibacter sp. lx-72]|uniref:hypothetical protein n=1 Tax=Canibacter zhuwentaonis TaxID=2837491 RepID=UPI001BDCB842|nr:hypothetical protein [Canibacter zhuwentaonis]MBT1018093.1 hypothetical protein [Canibacter zhuwentaonis]
MSENKTSPSDLAQARAAHMDLQQTLNLLEQRLDIPKRIDQEIAHRKQQVIDFRRKNPLGFTALIGAAAVTTAVAICFGIKAIIEKLN